MKSRLFVCNKAGDNCGICSWQYPSEYVPIKECFLGRHSAVKMIRHRHPLEVAVLMQIADIRAVRKDNHCLAELLLETLWRVLKEGRK